MKQRRSLEDRFWEKVAFPADPDGACWPWRGAVDKQTGYGRIGLGGRTDGTAGAHRVAFMLSGGFVPDAHEVCHACNTRACVNPAHLYAGTRADNVRDMLRAGTHRGFHNGAGRSRTAQPAGEVAA